MANENKELTFPLTPDTIFTLTHGGFVLVGKATLSSGTITVTNHRIKASSVALASYETPGGTTGTNLKAVCSDGSLAITGVDTSGSTVTTDTSTVSYVVFMDARDTT